MQSKSEPDFLVNNYYSRQGLKLAHRDPISTLRSQKKSTLHPSKMIVSSPKWSLRVAKSTLRLLDRLLHISPLYRVFYTGYLSLQNNSYFRVRNTGYFGAQNTQYFYLYNTAYFGVINTRY